MRHQPRRAEARTDKIFGFVLDKDILEQAGVALPFNMPPVGEVVFELVYGKTKRVNYIRSPRCSTGSRQTASRQCCPGCRSSRTARVTGNSSTCTDSCRTLHSANWWNSATPSSLRGQCWRGLTSRPTNVSCKHSATGRRAASSSAQNPVLPQPQAALPRDRLAPAADPTHGPAI